MAVNEIKSFLYIEEVEQNSGIQVTYYWEVKLAYIDMKGYYGSAYTNTNSTEIKWAHLDTFSEENAVEIMVSKCKKESK
ncbi:MAG: hypothetical protein ACQEWH_12050 [Bacillota bacterium]